MVQAMAHFKEGALSFIVLRTVFNVVAAAWVFVAYFKERVGRNPNIHSVRTSFNNRGKEAVNVFTTNNTGFILPSFRIKSGFVETLIMVTNTPKFIPPSIYKEDLGTRLKAGCPSCY